MSFAHWNAHVHMDGADAKWIGLGWGITDENSGDPNNYYAEITVTAPAEANATVGKVGVNEKVALISSDAPCDDDGIAIDVTFRVSAKPGATGSAVCIRIAENAGQRATPTKPPLREEPGRVGEEIVLRDVKVPGSCAGLTEMLNKLAGSRQSG